MLDCPELPALEGEPTTAVRDHLATCASCRMVVELLEERKRGVEALERRDECARFEVLLAARDEGTIGGTAGALLEAHLRQCAECQAVAATLPPVGERREHSSLPPVSTTAYALGREVARGGMGRILAAEDLRIGRRVAVKELLGRAPALAARFEREARVTARLQHPGIVPIYEIGQWPDGTPFYAMRMVEGRTLREAIRKGSTLDERLALLPAVIAAADAVAFAHAQRVIHRDLTPNNILVGAHGDTVVIDWGLAKDLSGTSSEEAEPTAGPYRDEAPDNGNLTTMGAVIGTAAYMPPEQARGERVDERADVYALGAILYHVLAGEPPYRASKSEDVVQQVRTGGPPSMSSVAPGAPRDLASIAEKAMARDPTSRYATAADLVAELRRFQTGRMVEAHHYSRRERTMRWIRAHRARVIAAITAIVAIGVVGSIGLAGVLRERDRAERERDGAEASRAVSEQERRRADQLSVGLLEDRGRRELLDGNRERAAVYLSAAYARGADSPALRFMLADAMTALDHEVRRLKYPGASHALFDHREQRIVVTRGGNHAAIFDVTTGAKVSELEGLPLDENRLYFSDDDETLFGRRQDTLLRWDVKTGKQTGSIVVHDGSFALTPVYSDGGLLATVGDKDGLLKIWDTRTLTRVAEQRVSPGVAAELLLSPDGRYLVVAPFEGNGIVLEAQTGRRLRELPGNTGRLVTFSGWNTFSPDGKRVVFGDVGGTVTIWDVETGRAVLSLRGHGAPAAAVFDPSGNRIVVFDFRHDGYVADAGTGVTLTRFRGGGMFYFGQFSSDGMRVIGTRIQTPTKGSVDVLDATSGTLLQRIEGRVLKQGVGRRVAVGDGDDVRIVDVTSGRLLHPRSTSLKTSAGFMTDSRHILTLDHDKYWLWDPDTKTSVPLAPEDSLLDTTADGSAWLVRAGSGAELRDARRVLAKLDDADTAHVLTTYDNRHVVVATTQGSVRVLASTTGAQVAEIDHKAKIVSLGCSQTGACATLDASGLLQVWTLDGATVASCRPGDGRATSSTLAGDGTRLIIMTAPQASATDYQPVLYSVDGCREIAPLGSPVPRPDVTIDFAGGRVLVDHTVWDANNGNRVADIPPSPTEHRVLLAPNGAHVARMSWFDTKLLSLRVGAAPTEIALDTAIGDGRFSRDGALFFAGVIEGGVDVVDMATGRVVARMPLPASVVVVTGRDIHANNILVDVSERGDKLVTAGPDPVVRVWNVTRETRSPQEIARIVDARSPWRLDGATLVRREDSAAPR